MRKIFSNLKPYWKSMIIILLLLIVQAVCDLSLPQYTSNIIDVGIQNSGVQHIEPEAIMSDEYELAQVLMTDEEKDLWKDAYTKEDEVYQLKKYDEDTLNDLDERFSVPLLMSSQMSAMEVSEFKSMMAENMQVDESALENVSVEDLGAQMGVELTPFASTKEDEDGNTVDVTCVDVRPVFQMMQQTGALTEESLTEIRETVSKTIDTMGSSLMKSAGVAYAVKCDEAAGVDVKKIQTTYLWSAGFRMIGMALIMGLATILVGFFASRVGAGVGRDLRVGVFEKVMKFSNSEMDQFSTASLITRTTNDVQQIQMVSILMIRMIAYAPILGIGGIIKVINTGAGLGWIIILAIIVLLGFIGLLMSLAMPKFKIMQTLVDKVNLVSREILTGLPVIRAFEREDREEERFDEANKDLTKTTLFTNRVMTFMMPVMMVIMYALTIMIVWFSAKKIDAGLMQVGSMTAFITYAMMIVMSFLMLTMLSVMLPRAGVAANRIDEVLKMEPTITDCANPVQREEVKGILKFEDVSFQYPGAKEDVLEHISFTALPGQTTAIIGSTGSGKSTLVNLIPRLYEVSEGAITLDGVDIRQLSLKDLRESIGYVPQKGILFSGTIASNLRFGNKDASDEEIREAAQIAQSVEFIEEKNAKYDSEIAQGGTNVSGGQKQRLSIARAIAKNPNIYIFDDSFSALDLKTDAALRKALSSKVEDKTVLIVAQRVSTIIHADQILVLEEGRIVGHGTHEQLLEDCEVYQQIAKSQLSLSELGLAD